MHGCGCYSNVVIDTMNALLTTCFYHYHFHWNNNTSVFSSQTTTTQGEQEGDLQLCGREEDVQFLEYSSERVNEGDGVHKGNFPSEGMEIELSVMEGSMRNCLHTSVQRVRGDEERMRTHMKFLASGIYTIK